MALESSSGKAPFAVCMMYRFQVTSWFLMIIFISEYFIFLVPIFDVWANIAIGIIFGLLAVTSVSGSLFLMILDPVDPSVKKGHDPSGFEVKGKHVIDENFFCSLCQVHV